METTTFLLRRCTNRILITRISTIRKTIQRNYMFQIPTCSSSTIQPITLNSFLNQSKNSISLKNRFKILILLNQTKSRKMTSYSVNHYSVPKNWWTTNNRNHKRSSRSFSKWQKDWTRKLIIYRNIANLFNRVCKRRMR